MVFHAALWKRTAALPSSKFVHCSFHSHLVTQEAQMLLNQMAALLPSQ